MGTRIRDVKGLSFFAIISPINTTIIANPSNAKGTIVSPPLWKIVIYFLTQMGRAGFPLPMTKFHQVFLSPGFPVDRVDQGLALKRL